MRLASVLPAPLAMGILALSVLSACSKNPTMLEFKPEDGASRSYQVIAETFVETDSSFGRNTDYMRSMMLTDYQVEQSEQTILHVKPTFMRMEYRNGSFASSREPEHFDKEVRELMSAGFQIHLDEDMQVTDFQFNASGQDTDGQDRDMLQDIFKDEFTRPGVAHGLRLREGASRTIEAEGDIPEVTITLSELRGDEAVVTMQGENQRIKVFGIAVVDIDSGWVTRATMVTDIEEEHQGSTASVRSVMSMYPSDWAMGMDLEYLSQTGMGPLEDSVDFDQLSEAASEQEALPNPTGFIESRNDHLELNYHHDSRGGNMDVNALGQFELRDAQAFTLDGTALDLPLQLSEALTYTYYGSEQILTMADAYPLGWQDVHEKLADLGYVQATLDWYPQTQHPVELEVSNSTTRLKDGDATAILRPTDDDNVYQLIIEQGMQVHFDYRIGGASAVGLGYKPYPLAPDWLDQGESRLLTVTEYGYHPGYYEIYFEGEPPATLQLLAIRVADEPAASRQISFYDADAMNANPYVAPPENAMLYADQTEQQHANIGTLDLDPLTFTAQPQGDFELEDFGRAQLYLTLTPEQAGLCEVTTHTDDLQWHELPAPEGQRLPPGKLNDPVILQVQTPDQRRQFFYQQEVEVTTSCPEHYEWQVLDIDIGEHPWLIDIDQLEGIDADTPLTRLLRTYAFLPVQAAAAPDSPEGVRARSLALIAPTTGEHAERPNYFDATVADYLYEDRYLRVAGTVQSVMHLHSSNARTERTFAHQFPPLPDMDTTFAEDNATGDNRDE